MELFDNAVSKAKEVFEVVSQKTGEAVTVGKQKFDISSLENKIKKDYEQLGKLYFEKLKDEVCEDEEVAQIVVSIQAKKEQILDLRAQLNAAKNKRICPNCGAAIEESSVYCNFCGAELVIESKTEE